MNRTALTFCICLAACGEKVTLTVIVAQTKVGEREVKLGEQMEGRTGRFWEGSDKLFVIEGGAALPAPAGVMRAPIPVVTMYVLAPFTTTHADDIAEDRGTKRLEIGSKVLVAKDLPGMNANVLLLVDDGKPKVESNPSYACRRSAPAMDRRRRPRPSVGCTSVRHRRRDEQIHGRAHRVR